MGLALAATVSAVAEDTAYMALFGISVFGAIVVWILILASHWVFRRDGPRSSVRLWAAPVTTRLAALFLVVAMVSTAFIDELDTAWMASVPFFAVLVIAVSRRGFRR